MMSSLIRALVMLVMAALTYWGDVPDGITPPVAAFIEANIEAVEAAKIRGSFEDDPYPFGGMAPNPFAHWEEH